MIIVFLENECAGLFVFVLLLMEDDYFILCKMSIECLLKDLGEDLGSWTHGNYALTRKLMWSTLIFCHVR